MRATRFANAVFILAATYFLGLLVYSLTDGTPLIYAPVLGILAGACLACLRIPPDYRVNLALAGVSIGLALMVVEVFLTLHPESFYPEPYFYKDAKNQNIAFDPRTRLQVIKDFRRRGADAYPSFVPAHYLQMTDHQIYPLGGISNQTIVVCNESGQYLIYESDEHGFHNPKGIWGRDRIDVVTVGDSFTHGRCVESEKNISALIRDAYENTLNLGMDGTGPLIELAILKEYASNLKPEVVLWFYTEGNDLEELVHNLNVPLLKRYLEGADLQNLVDRQPEIDGVLIDFMDRELSGRVNVQVKLDVDTLRLIKVRTKFFNQFLDPTIDQLFFRAVALKPLNRNNFRDRVVQWHSRCEVTINDEVFGTFGTILEEAKRSVEAWGGELYFVYLPDGTRYKDDPLDQGTCGGGRFTPSVESHDRVLRIVTSVGLPIIDMNEVFDSHPDPLSLFPFRMRAHYNEDGYRLVAETVLAAINAEN